MEPTATAINEAYYDEFWQSCPDFSRYNPGVLHRRRAVLKRLQSIAFKSLLDVGCGDGELLVWLRERLPAHIAMYGVDLSSQTILKNRERHPHAQFDVLNIEHGHLERSFDAVVCTEVIEHLDDRPRAMRNLGLMLNPGGHLVLTCPSGKVHATERRFGHVSHPTPDELRDMVGAAGLEVISLQNWGFPLYKGLKYLTNLRPEMAIRSFASGRYSTSARLISHFLYLANFLNLSTASGGCQQFLVARRPAHS
jgi:2-polyprenyl-3-methyl-5-hydroxy-6-metoxy-1,4-benzoquinol methylase